MTPDLSRRIAAALHALPAEDLTPAQRVDLAVEAEPCNTFEQLPEWIRQTVTRGEQNS